MKTLNNENTEQTKTAATDVQVTGCPDAWVLICKASSEKEGWMKSTKAMVTATGVIVQVSTQQGDHVAEALVFIPGADVIEEDGHPYIT